MINTTSCIRKVCEGARETRESKERETEDGSSCRLQWDPLTSYLRKLGWFTESNPC